MKTNSKEFDRMEKQNDDDFTKKDAIVGNIKPYSPVIATGIGVVASAGGDYILSNRKRAFLIGLYTFIHGNEEE